MRIHEYRPHDESFTVNGRTYTRRYTRWPKKSSSGRWIVFSDYYECLVRGELLILTLEEWRVRSIHG
jgi:hypothetical protein